VTNHRAEYCQGEARLAPLTDLGMKREARATYRANAITLNPVAWGYETDRLTKSQTQISQRKY